MNHFFNLPGSIPVLGWLLIFNTLIAGLITSFINAKLLEPITRLSKAMKEVLGEILNSIWKRTAVSQKLENLIKVLTL